MINSAVRDLELKRIDEGLSGVTISTQLTTYRLKVFQYAIYANLSMGMLERFKPALRLNGSMSIGNATDLPRMLSSAVIEKEISKLKMILDECYPFFSTVSDGSPVGADAKCLIVRAVDRKTHCIRQVLISVRIY